MKTENELKSIVQEKYGQIAIDSQTVKSGGGCGCGCGTPNNKVYNIMMDDYSGKDGYVPDADLGLGCGVPTDLAQMKPGHTVIDLGSGAGNDCFVARAIVGDTGKVIGIDFTPEMVAKAKANAQKVGYTNVEFRQGDIDDMPVRDNLADVVISNCVLNLVPNKSAVMSEIFRVLKPGGHFSISDVVTAGPLPDALRADATLYAGCISGAVTENQYIGLLMAAGFEYIEIKRRKPITLPDDLLAKHLTPTEVEDFKKNGYGVSSITVFGIKPGAEPRKGCCS